MFDRRTVLVGAASSVVLPGVIANAQSARTMHATQALPTDVGLKWMDVLGRLPYSPAAKVGSQYAPIVYMFSNKKCGYCHAFLNRYPNGFTKAQMRYIVAPWPSDINSELGQVYSARRETTFRTYMADRLEASPSLAGTGSRIAPVVSATKDKLGELFINKGNSKGTPMFLTHFYLGNEKPPSIYLTAGLFYDLFDNMV